MLGNTVPLTGKQQQPRAAERNAAPLPFFPFFWLNPAPFSP
jgi:hypothetical protein